MAFGRGSSAGTQCRIKGGDWMSYRSYCDLCHESYDSDNLITCQSCDRDFCYHCGDSGGALCQRCLDKQGTSQPSE
jgi:hypothetical protein